MLYAEMRKYVLIKIEMAIVSQWEYSALRPVGIAPSRRSAQPW